MATLTDTTIASTYKQLLKLTSEGVSADASAKYVEDGLGTDTALSLSTTRVGIGTASPDHTLHLTTSDTDVAMFASTATGTTGAQLLLYHNSSSPADGDRIGAVVFQGEDDGGNGNSYAGIRAFAVDVSNGSEDGALSLHTQNAGTFTEAMYISETQQVGIGTDSPGDLLHISNGDNAIDTRIRLQAFGQLPVWHTYYAAGTESSPSAPTSGTEMGRWEVQTYDGNDYSQSAGKIQIIAESSHASDDAHSYMAFSTCNDEARLSTEKMRITGAGTLQVKPRAGDIGTADTAARTLILGGRPSSADFVSLGFDADGDYRGNWDFQASTGEMKWWAYDSSWSEVLKLERGGNTTFSGSAVFNNCAFSSAYSIRRASNALILTGGTNGYYFNNDDNSLTDMCISAAGNVGIGISAPGDLRLNVVGNIAGEYLARFHNDGNLENRYGISVSAGEYSESGSNYYFTAQDGNGSNTGYLKSVGGTFQLSDTSDIRLKENVKDTTLKGIETVDKIKVRDFDWKKNDNTVIGGFIANELKEVYPQAVDGEADDVWEDGSIKAMTVSRDVLVPLLVKAVQELSAKVEDLKTELQDTKDYVDHKQDYNSIAGRLNSCEARIGHLEKG